MRTGCSSCTHTTQNGMRKCCIRSKVPALQDKRYTSQNLATQVVFAPFELCLGSVGSSNLSRLKLGSHKSTGRVLVHAVAKSLREFCKGQICHIINFMACKARERSFPMA